MSVIPGASTDVRAAASPWLGVAGAVAAEGADSGVAWHYGDPVAEQRRLEQGVALVDLSNRGVVTITGPDRLSWLHSLTTQALDRLAPGVSTETLVLSPHGHVEHALHLVDDGTTTWITVEPGSTEALVTWLDRMRFMLRVEVRDVTADWAVLGQGSRDPEPSARLSSLGAAVVWVDPWPAVSDGSASYALPDAVHPPFSWREIVIPRTSLDDASRLPGQLAGSAGELAGTWASEAMRIAGWRPRLGFETDHRTIPHEVDWLRTAVHLHKGCYRGQETVARVHNLGRPPRRLVFLHLDGSGHTVPGLGAPVLLGDRAVGRLTSVARHHELGPIGLAVIKRNTPADLDLLVDGIAASQETVVAP